MNQKKKSSKKQGKKAKDKERKNPWSKIEPNNENSYEENKRQ